MRRAALAAALLACVPEAALTFAVAFRELLTARERLEVLGGLVGAGLLVGALAVVVVAATGARRVAVAGLARVLLATGAGVAVGFAAFATTAGRRVAEHPLRPVVVGLAALAAWGAAGWALGRARRGGRLLSRCAPAVVVGALLADRYVLPRLYPAFHALLAGVVVAVSLLVAVEVAARAPAAPKRRATPLLVALVGIFGLYGLVRAAAAPNPAYVLERHATVAGRMVRAVGAARTATRRAVRPAPRPRAVSPARPGVSLGHPDVLLLTIDALRADRLRAYGGTGLTPAMDALAAEGVVFRRAYTTTPHTSYALSSLLTGKYLRPLFELGGPTTDHVAMPELLRRYGYRTAAFYPPAIFFVDEGRFRALADQGFGFEYRKVMYAPAPARVTQLEAYLREAPTDHPVFAWVHLFEPHEPYEPPAELVTGEGDEAAYDGEVRVVDAAVEALVRTFRRLRPGATVILTADHGEEFGDHGGRYHGSTLFDEQVRVPLVWSSPGRVAPRVVDAPVDHVDVATTLLSALDIPRDARMRGDDLGPLLRDGQGGPTAAFADIAEQRMITDGRFKAVCEASRDLCALFDLVEDPRERRNLAGVRPDVVARLSEELGSFVASVADVEALARGAAGIPPALARAELLDRTVIPALLELLRDPDSPHHAAVLRALVRLRAEGLQQAACPLARAPDAEVQVEAAIACVVGGDTAHVATVRAAASGPDAERARRAAVALAQVGDEAGEPALAACVGDATVDEVGRRACVSALGGLRGAAGEAALVAALDDVRLRGDVATALAARGAVGARAALLERLRSERYVPPREALVQALTVLGERGLEPHVRRYLGMASGIPNGVGWLLEHGALRDGTDLRQAPPPGARCDAVGCSLEADLPVAVTRPGRLVVRVVARDGALVSLGDRTFGPLPEGPNELTVAVAPGTLPVTLGAAVLVAYVVVPSVAEIPPPQAEPWDAGTP